MIPLFIECRRPSSDKSNHFTVIHAYGRASERCGWSTWGSRVPRTRLHATRFNCFMQTGRPRCPGSSPIAVRNLSTSSSNLDTIYDNRFVYTDSGFPPVRRTTFNCAAVRHDTLLHLPTNHHGNARERYIASFCYARTLYCTVYVH